MESNLNECITEDTKEVSTRESNTGTMHTLVEECVRNFLEVLN